MRLYAPPVTASRLVCRWCCGLATTMGRCPRHLACPRAACCWLAPPGAAWRRSGAEDCCRGARAQSYPCVRSRRPWSPGRRPPSWRSPGQRRRCPVGRRTPPRRPWPPPAGPPGRCSPRSAGPDGRCVVSPSLTPSGSLLGTHSRGVTRAVSQQWTVRQLRRRCRGYTKAPGTGACTSCQVRAGPVESCSVCNGLFIVSPTSGRSNGVATTVMSPRAPAVPR